MFIRSLTLRNILSFREPGPLELKPLNILIGANASGKSNLIDCIELLRALPTSLINFLNPRGGAEGWIWHGPGSQGNTARVECAFELDRTALSYGIEFGAIERTPVIQAEVLEKAETAANSSYLKRVPGSIQIGDEGTDGNVGIAQNESVLAVYRNPLDPNPITRSARKFGGTRIYRAFPTAIVDDIRRGVSSSGAKHPLDDTGSNLALVLQEMDFHGALQNVKQYLRRLSDRFEDLKINLEGGRAQLYLEERGLGKVSATRLSDGTLKVLCLLAILLDHDPAPLVCIEEPESGLHPDALALVADALREASSRMQIVVTTHSDALVDRFTDEPEHVVVCERGFDEGTQFRRLSSDQLKEWLDEYTLGDLWRRGEIGGTQR